MLMIQFLYQHSADNVDHIIVTIDGLNTFHDMSHTFKTPPKRGGGGVSEDFKMLSDGGGEVMGRPLLKIYTQK